MEKEEWKDIQGYEELYQVSNFGRIKSLERSVNYIAGSTKNISEKIRKTEKTGNNYSNIYLYKEGKRKCLSVHKIVASHFISNPKELPQINHKDGVKQNNNINNLEWCSASQNTIHAVKNQLRISRKGEAVNFAKLNSGMVKEIKRLLATGSMTQSQIASLFNVEQSSISHINTNKTWNHI